MIKRVAVVGLATLDYVLTTQAPLRGTGTVLARLMTNGSWPRAGGAALYAGRRLAAAGHSTSPLVTIGDDINGKAYLQACVDAGLRVEGIATVPDAKTPSCLLIYHDDGAYTCLLDLGSSLPGHLASGYADALANADLVVVAAAGTPLIRSVLSQVRPAQRLAWIAKNDPNCFPLDLCPELTSRADYLFCNSSELHMVEPFLDRAKSGATLFETRGADGVRVRCGMQDQFVVATPVEVADATGAGDTFAGEVLAAILRGGETAIAAAQRGIDQVHQMLLERVGELH